MSAAAVDDGVETDERPPFDWRILAACVATGLLGLGLGLLVSRPTEPSASSVDVGFLQDMRYHHEQAVGMSLMLLGKPAEGANPSVRQAAREIVQSQAFEGGRMAEMLRGFGAPVANEGDTAMRWMGMAVPLDEMPGMATADETAELSAALGRAADLLFIRLMIAHHEGGLHMAEDAQARARDDKVERFAAGIIDGQTKEIAELRAIAAKL
jgi:uncharacterized protein (DUF305 family)